VCVEGSYLYTLGCLSSSVRKVGSRSPGYALAAVSIKVRRGGHLQNSSSVAIPIERCLLVSQQNFCDHARR
jgi:hypothetical protein